MLQKKMHGKPLIYFDNAATTQKPTPVIATIENFYKEHYSTVHRAIYELASHSTEKYEEVRKKVKDFINASKIEEIIFTKGTTEAINLVASSFGKAFIKPQDEVIISQMEHHSNIVPWQMVCEERGALLKVIPMKKNGELDLEIFQNLLTEKTKIVAVAHIANSTGTINPIEDIIKLAHSKGAYVLIDGAQAAPHIPVDVQKLEADFYVFSGHKMYGPTGIGILYGKEELLLKMPPYQGGGDMIEKVTFKKTTYNQLPLKFEAGTPLIAEVMGLGAAIDYLHSIGLNQIENYEHELLKYATHKIKTIDGITLLGEALQKAALITFIHPSVHPLDLGTLLDLEGIAIRTGHLCAQPALSYFNVSSACRVSFSFYNTKEEIDFFIDTLKTSLKKLL